MKYVYRLHVVLGETVAVDVLYRNEEDALNHADGYIESVFPYVVTVEKEEVH